MGADSPTPAHQNLIAPRARRFDYWRRHERDTAAPVTFRGVTIGKVEAMQVQLDEKNHTGVIPVYIRIRSSKRLAAIGYRPSPV